MGSRRLGRRAPRCRQPANGTRPEAAKPRGSVPRAYCVVASWSRTLSMFPPRMPCCSVSRMVWRSAIVHAPKRSGGRVQRQSADSKPGCAPTRWRGPYAPRVRGRCVSPCNGARPGEPKRASGLRVRCARGSGRRRRTNDILADGAHNRPDDRRENADTCFGRSKRPLPKAGRGLQRSIRLLLGSLQDVRCAQLNVTRRPATMRSTSSMLSSDICRKPA